MAALQLFSLSSYRLKSFHFKFSDVNYAFFSQKPRLAQGRVAVSATSAEPAKPDSSQPQETQSAPKKKLEKPVYSLKKGQIVRVDKEKYLNSINYLSVGHPKYYKGLDYIYEDRGEVLDVRIFETGEYALIAWVGIPTAPAWLPTYMLIKSERLNYQRV